MDEALADNAAVLARMAEQGDDLTQARDVEFAHVFEETGSANAFCEWAIRRGYSATVETREDVGIDVIVRQRMSPDLTAITELELELAASAKIYSGRPDGWGCFAVARQPT